MDAELFFLTGIKETLWLKTTKSCKKLEFGSITIPLMKLLEWLLRPVTKWERRVKSLLPLDSAGVHGFSIIRSKKRYKWMAVFACTHHLYLKTWGVATIKICWQLRTVLWWLQQLPMTLIGQSPVQNGKLVQNLLGMKKRANSTCFQIWHTAG